MWRVYAYYPNSDACDFWTEDTESEAIETMHRKMHLPEYSGVAYVKLTREEIELAIYQLRADLTKPMDKASAFYGVDTADLRQSSLDSIARYEKALKEFD